MIEAEWLARTDPAPMLEFLRGKASDRKLRLFAVACCRRVSQLLLPIARPHHVEIGERYADGLADEDERRAVQGWNRSPAIANAASPSPDEAAHYGPLNAASVRAFGGGFGPDTSAWHQAQSVERSIQAVIVRDDFGNPFRNVALNPAWRTPTAPNIDQAIYDDRRIDGLPILADALEEAGCDNADILTHYREPGPHARGCWAVDLILGKT